MQSAWAAYLGAAILGELVLPLAPAGTALIDAAVLVAALTHFGWAQRSPIAIGDPAIRLLPAVALVPLLRLLSLTLPAPELSPVAWLAVGAGPILLAILASARLTHFDVGEMALAKLSSDWLSLLVVVGSLPAGLIVGWLAPMRLAAPTDSPPTLALVAAILVVGAAIPEELVFRGLFQPLVQDIVGRTAPTVTSVAFAATYIGTRSPGVVLVMAAMGLVYGWEVVRSGSLWPAIVGHSVLVLSGVFLAPRLVA